MKPNWILHLILAAGLGMGLLSCSAPPDLSAPPEIVYGEDICVECGMIISEPRFAAAYITIDGEARIFDDLGELCLYFQESQEEVAAFWAHDFKSEDWIDAERATIVVGEEIHTPMGFGVVAFQDASEAANFAEEMHGQVLDFKSYLESCPMGAHDGHG